MLLVAQNPYRIFHRATVAPLSSTSGLTDGSILSSSAGPEPESVLIHPSSLTSFTVPHRKYVDLRTSEKELTRLAEPTEILWLRKSSCSKFESYHGHGP